MCQIEGVVLSINGTGGVVMNNLTTIGIDLAKSSFSVHGVDARGKRVFRKTLSRGKLLPFLAQQPPSLIGMEACSGAHRKANRARPEEA
jgi:hypothetical protein